MDALRGGYLESLGNLMRHNPSYVLQVGLGLAVLLWGILPGRRPLAPDSRFNQPRRGLVAVVLTQLLALLVVARQSYQFPRYLLPASCLFGLGLLLAGKLFAGRGTTPRPLARRAAVIGLLSVLSWLRFGDIHRELLGLEVKRRDQTIAVAIAEQRFAGSTKVYFFQSSSLRHALYFGNGHADFAYARELRRLYPDSYFYNVWARAFCSFDRAVPLTRIQQKDPRFLLQGSTRPQGAWLPFPVEVVYRGKHESLFRLVVSFPEPMGAPLDQDRGQGAQGERPERSEGRARTPPP
jgi:hypothetical protein